MKSDKLGKGKVKQIQTILALVFILFFGIVSVILICKIAGYFIDAGKSQIGLWVGLLGLSLTGLLAGVFLIIKPMTIRTNLNKGSKRKKK